MKNYYFTFGQSHFTRNGYPMKDVWVRVVSENYNDARTKFIDNFTTHNMIRPDSWAFQYEEENFNKEYFPAGEYLVIN